VNTNLRKPAALLGMALALTLHAAAFAQNDPPGFAQTLPSEVRWSQSASLLHGGQSAPIYGDARKPGLYVNRVKQPALFRVMPHTHPEERLYTVISGTFYVGFGDKFDPEKLKAFPAGSSFVVPANTPHFHWMRSGEAVVQISGIGPSGIDYVDHADDPRTK